MGVAAIGPIMIALILGVQPGKADPTDCIQFGWSTVRQDG